MILTLAIAGLFFLPDPWRLIFLCVALVVEVGEVFAWIRFLRRYRVTTGAEGLIGERAEVLAGWSPAAGGHVRVRGEIWTARGELTGGEGALVRVARVDGLTLVVEPDAPEPGG